MLAPRITSGFARVGASWIWTDVRHHFKALFSDLARHTIVLTKQLHVTIGFGDITRGDQIAACQIPNKVLIIREEGPGHKLVGYGLSVCDFNVRLKTYIDLAEGVHKIYPQIEL